MSLTGRTHFLTGLCVGVLYAGVSETSDSMIPIVIASAAGALLPDVDNCTSVLGRKVFPASLAIQATFHHRTLFHSPLLYGVLWALLSGLFPQYQYLLNAALIGIGSHLVLDMLNPKGIPLLYPIPKRFHLANFKSGGLLDHLLQPVLLLCCGYLFFFC